MKWLLLRLLEGYKRFVSPALPHSCRFVPTCSEYAAQAIEIHGVVRGVGLTVWRVCRCNPFGGSGVDPVPMSNSVEGTSKRSGESHTVHDDASEFSAQQSFVTSSSAVRP